MNPTRYRIVVRGRLSRDFVPGFEEMCVEATDGGTALTGEIRDEAHLYGVLDLLRDFGIELVSVNAER